VDQAFGNCPKFITPRGLELHTPEPASSLDVRALPDAAVRSIARADTCFIASASAGRPERQPASQGVDVSHRGGPAGFVRVGSGPDGRLQLQIPDYPGNNAFNTLGNLTLYPRAGLLIPDFTTGELLSLAGRCEVQWQGQERSLRFDVERALGWSGVLLS
jgi:hypothetical protein